MKKTYLIFLFFIITGSASAQITDALNRKPVENKTVPEPKIRICAPSRAGIIANPPLYVINKTVINNTAVLDYLRAANVGSVKVLKPDEGIKIYGENAKNGVIEINFQHDVKLLSLPDLFKAYKIKKKYWDLPVFVEDKKLISTNEFYLAGNIVNGVELIKSEDKVVKDPFIRVSLKPL